MNKKIKARWVKALRSGKYEQGRSSLKIIEADGSKSYCCLGVLCELYCKSNKVEFTEINVGSNYPNSKVCEWAGLAGPHDEGKVSQNDLAKMNDEEYGWGHKTFKGIATIIEKNL